MPNRASRLVAAAILTAFAAGAAGAKTITLRPGEAESTDVFVYAFSIPSTLGIPTPPNTSNLDTANVPASAAVPFGAFLGAAETEPSRIDPGNPAEPLREHTTRSLIQFDVGSTGLDAGRVRAAHLELTALPACRPSTTPRLATRSTCS